MSKKAIILVAAVFFLYAGAVSANAECSSACKEKKEKKEHACGNGPCGSACKETGMKETEIEVFGNVKSVDLDKNEMTVLCDGSGEELTIQAKAEDIDRLKPGQKVRVVYEKKGRLVASKVSRLRAVMIPPKPCTNKKLD